MHLAVHRPEINFLPSSAHVRLRTIRDRNHTDVRDELPSSPPPHLQTSGIMSRRVFPKKKAKDVLKRLTCIISPAFLLQTKNGDPATRMLPEAGFFFFFLILPASLLQQLPNSQAMPSPILYTICVKYVCKATWGRFFIFPHIYRAYFGK